ncbi:hypothetical protein F5144DRAFT_7138 [Chaetomium tenue]|uniref:Uncharacterized protein n=1 Tax=Chaetomium tenue TaxID=1854479 RepID=A0ACB7PQY7_9PEZI|nr:hypothetical protein F5144DRAFT_7138 [Chaetomium globosum]
MAFLSARVSRLLLHLFRGRGRATTTKGSLFPQSTTDFSSSLPEEISLMVLSYLPVESLIALALTSRVLRQSIPPLRLLLDDEGKLHVLEFLEKDVPHLYACHQCLRLHPWRRMAVLPHIGRRDRCGRSCRLWRALPLINSTVPDRRRIVTYPLARSIMNRHLYGEEHGPPLEVLRRTATENKPLLREGVAMTQAWSARIIDDELYLEATVQFYLQEGNEAMLRNVKGFDKAPPPDGSFWLGGEHPPQVWRLARAGECRDRPKLTEDQTLVCQHISGECRRVRVFVCHVPAQSDTCSCLDPSFFPRVGKIRSCRECFTDFQVDVQWHPPDSEGPKGWVLKITRWHRLGKCRSPLDAEWHNYQQGRGGRKTVRRDDTSWSPGMVYQNWMASGEPPHRVAEDVGNNLAEAAFSEAWWPINVVV